MRKTDFIFLIVILFLSCSSFPSWVKKNNLTDYKSGCICAKGMSGPSYYREDTIEKAKINARIELAANIRINIKSYTVDLLSDRGNETVVSHFVKLSESLIDEVVENSEIVEQWFDKNGEAGPVNYAYAIACIKKEAAEGIKSKIKEEIKK